MNIISLPYSSCRPYELLKFIKPADGNVVVWDQNNNEFVELPISYFQKVKEDMIKSGKTPYYDVLRNITIIGSYHHLPY